MVSAIESRRSVRKYKQDGPVTRQQLDGLLHAAMLAPSARNSRPWEFIVITKREILDKIESVHPNANMLKTAAAAIVVVAVPQPGIAEGYYPQDCGAATQNILLEAVEMGLGACWCGVYPREERVASISGILNIEKPKIPFNVIAIGVPDEAPAQRGFFEADRVTYVE